MALPSERNGDSTKVGRSYESEDCYEIVTPMRPTLGYGSTSDSRSHGDQTVTWTGKCASPSLGFNRCNLPLSSPNSQGNYGMNTQNIGARNRNQMSRELQTESDWPKKSGGSDSLRFDESNHRASLAGTSDRDAQLQSRNQREQINLSPGQPTSVGGDHLTESDVSARRKSLHGIEAGGHRGNYCANDIKREPSTSPEAVPQDENIEAPTKLSSHSGPTQAMISEIKRRERFLRQFEEPLDSKMSSRSVKSRHMHADDLETEREFEIIRTTLPYRTQHIASYQTYQKERTKNVTSTAAEGWFRPPKILPPPASQRDFANPKANSEPKLVNVKKPIKASTAPQYPAEIGLPQDNRAISPIAAIIPNEAVVRELMPPKNFVPKKGGESRMRTLAKYAAAAAASSSSSSCPSVKWKETARNIQYVASGWQLRPPTYCSLEDATEPSISPQVPSNAATSAPQKSRGDQGRKLFSLLKEAIEDAEPQTSVEVAIQCQFAEQSRPLHDARGMIVNEHGACVAHNVSDSSVSIKGSPLDAKDDGFLLNSADSSTHTLGVKRPQGNSESRQDANTHPKNTPSKILYSPNRVSSDGIKASVQPAAAFKDSASEYTAPVSAASEFNPSKTSTCSDTPANQGTGLEIAETKVEDLLRRASKVFKKVRNFGGAPDQSEEWETLHGEFRELEGLVQIASQELSEVYLKSSADMVCELRETGSGETQSPHMVSKRTKAIQTLARNAMRISKLKRELEGEEIIELLKFSKVLTCVAGQLHYLLACMFRFRADGDLALSTRPGTVHRGGADSNLQLARLLNARGLLYKPRDEAIVLELAKLSSNKPLRVIFYTYRALLCQDGIRNDEGLLFLLQQFLKRSKCDDGSTSGYTNFSHLGGGTLYQSSSVDGSVSALHELICQLTWIVSSQVSQERLEDLGSEIGGALTLAIKIVGLSQSSPDWYWEALICLSICFIDAATRAANERGETASSYLRANENNCSGGLLAEEGEERDDFERADGPANAEPSSEHKPICSEVPCSWFPQPAVPHLECKPDSSFGRVIELIASICDALLNQFRSEPVSRQQLHLSLSGCVYLLDLLRRWVDFQACELPSVKDLKSTLLVSRPLIAKLISACQLAAAHACRLHRRNEDGTDNCETDESRGSAPRKDGHSSKYLCSLGPVMPLPKGNVFDIIGGPETLFGGSIVSGESSEESHRIYTILGLNGGDLSLAEAAAARKELGASLRSYRDVPQYTERQRNSPYHTSWCLWLSLPEDTTLLGLQRIPLIYPTQSEKLLESNNAAPIFLFRSASHLFFQVKHEPLEENASTPEANGVKEPEENVHMINLKYGESASDEMDSRTEQNVSEHTIRYVVSETYYVDDLTTKRCETTVPLENFTSALSLPHEVCVTLLPTLVRLHRLLNLTSDLGDPCAEESSSHQKDPFPTVQSTSIVNMSILRNNLIKKVSRRPVRNVADCCSPRHISHYATRRNPRDNRVPSSPQILGQRFLSSLKNEGSPCKKTHRARRHFENGALPIPIRTDCLPGPVTIRLKRRPALSRRHNRSNTSFSVSPSSVQKTEKAEAILANPVVNTPRLVVIDASNVAITHGSSLPQKKTFSSEGLRIAIRYFQAKNYKVLALVPENATSYEKVGAARRALDAQISNRIAQAPDNVTMLIELKSEGLLFVTPPQDYDDSYCIKYAFDREGCVVTNDMYRDFAQKAGNSRIAKRWLKEHLISFAFVGGEFVPNPDFRWPKPWELGDIFEDPREG